MEVGPFSIRLLTSPAENGRGNFKEKKAVSRKDQDIYPAVEQPPSGEQGLPESIHGIGQGQAITDDLKDHGHRGEGEKNTAKEDHGEAEEIGEGHGLEDLSHADRNQNPQKSKGKTGKERGKEQRERVESPQPKK